MKPILLVLPFLVACDGASVSFGFTNLSAARTTGTSGVLADGTSLRVKLIAAYLAEDVDPVTLNNVGDVEMIWVAPECGGDIENCNVEGFDEPAGGPRVTTYFDSRAARRRGQRGAQLAGDLGGDR